MKKTLTTLLVALMATLLFAVSAFAAGSYEFDSTSGELTVYTTEGLTAWEGTVDPDDIKSLVVKSAVNEVNGFFFYNLSALESIVFEGDVTAGLGCFTKLPALESIVFEGDATLQYDCFNRVPALKSVKFEGESVLSQNVFSGSVLLEELTFAEKTTLGNGALKYGVASPNTKLKELVFPAGSTFGEDAVGGFSALESIVFEGDVVLNKNCLEDIYYLKSVEFKGESVIGDSSFTASLRHLETMTFAKKTTVGGAVFYLANFEANTALKELVFPAGSTLASANFYNFGALEHVVFEGDITLYSNCFTRCSGLKTVEFMGDVTIDKDAFGSTPAMESLIFHSENAPTFGTPEAFLTLGENAVAYVPCHLIDEYTASFEENKVRGEGGILQVAQTHDLALDKNEEGHWEYCKKENCDLRYETEPHTFGEWVTTLEPTTQKEGVKEHECSVCSYVETGKIDKLADKTENPDTGDTTNMALYFALMAASMSALLVFKKHAFEK